MKIEMDINNRRVDGANQTIAADIARENELNLKLGEELKNIDLKFEKKKIDDFSFTIVDLIDLKLF